MSPRSIFLLPLAAGIFFSSSALADRVVFVCDGEGTFAVSGNERVARCSVEWRLQPEVSASASDVSFTCAGRFAPGSRQGCIATGSEAFVPLSGFGGDAVALCDSSVASNVPVSGGFEARCGAVSGLAQYGHFVYAHPEWYGVEVPAVTLHDLMVGGLIVGCGLMFAIGFGSAQRG